MKLDHVDETTLRELCARVSSETGVQLGARQRPMILSRLATLAKRYRLGSPGEVLALYARDPDARFPTFVSAFTTHHTSFFRDFAQFEYLADSVLPALLPAVAKRADPVLCVWSAACSRGQEAYSLTIFLREQIARSGLRVDFRILGTDVCGESVDRARNAVYPLEELAAVPSAYRARPAWVPGTGEVADFARISRELRERCEFRQQNLLRIDSEMPKDFDLIFCRNVFIYFTPTQIQSVCHRLLGCLRREGHFLIGLSESLSGLDLPLEACAASVYRRTDFTQPSVPTAKGEYRVQRS